MQNKLKTADLSSIGQEITHDLGAKMVKDFQDAYENEPKSNTIGRNIIERILQQPGCAGIKFYNAVNEFGDRTLVYVGIDENDNDLLENSFVNTDGYLVKEKGIVADRVRVDNEETGTKVNYWWP